MADHSYMSSTSSVNMANSNVYNDVENENVGECNKEGDELLIDLIKSYPHLWNKEDKDYKDVNKCDNSWQEIATVMHLSVKECMSRWCRLRQYYSKERQSQEFIPSGSAPNKKRPWDLYEQMSFIDKHIYKRRRKYTNISRSVNEPSQSNTAEKHGQKSPLSDITNKDDLQTESLIFTSSTSPIGSDSENVLIFPLSPQSTSSEQSTLFQKKMKPITSSDTLEKSLNMVSQSVSAMATRMFLNDNVNDRDEALTKMILAELQNTAEPKKSELRRKLMNVIME
ncbi:PREDICTED: transcription factor Adf-1-like [Cyphomyrmex costatus]|nr:PREDICTED: transcription factor Adf-1-like [Cyphomyrmex costatus]